MDVIKIINRTAVLEIIIKKMTMVDENVLDMLDVELAEGEEVEGDVDADDDDDSDKDEEGEEAGDDDVDTA